MYRTKYAKTPILWLVALGALGAMLYRANHGVEVFIRIPVSTRWLEQKRRRKIRGYVGLVLAFAGIFVFALLAFVLPIFGMFDAGMVAAAAMGLCVLAVLGAAIYLAMTTAELVKRAEGAYAWLAGCSRDVVATLPEFPGAYVLDAYVSQQLIPAELADAEL